MRGNCRPRRFVTAGQMILAGALLLCLLPQSVKGLEPVTLSAGEKLLLKSLPMWKEIVPLDPALTSKGYKWYVSGHSAPFVNPSKPHRDDYKETAVRNMEGAYKVKVGASMMIRWYWGIKHASLQAWLVMVDQPGKLLAEERKLGAGPITLKGADWATQRTAQSRNGLQMVTIAFCRGPVVGYMSGFKATAKVERAAAETILGKLAANGIKAAGAKGEPTSKPADDPDAEGFDLDLAAYASGYILAEKTITIAAPDPQKVVLSGRVLDDQGQPIAGAEVSVTNYAESILADEAGRYSLTLEFADGRGSRAPTQDFALAPEPTSLVIKLDPVIRDPKAPFPPLANGKSIKMRATVLGNGKPFAKQWIRVDYPTDYYKGNASANYVSLNRAWGCDTRFYTDENGQAVFSMGVPRARKDTQTLAERNGFRKFHEDLFPVRGELRFVSEGSGAEGVVPIDYACPFPRITRLAMPELRFGDWPRLRSHLRWSNPIPCEKYTVRFLMPGDIRVPARPGVTVTAGTRGARQNNDDGDTSYEVRCKLSLDVNVTTMGKTALEFGLAPSMRGSDFTDIPEFGEELKKAMVDVASEYAVTRAGGLLLDNLGGNLSKLAYKNVVKGENLRKAGKVFESARDWHRAFAQSRKAAGEGLKAINASQAAMAKAGKATHSVVKASLQQVRNTVAMGKAIAKSKLAGTVSVAAKAGAKATDTVARTATKLHKVNEVGSRIAKGRPLLQRLGKRSAALLNAEAGYAMNVAKSTAAHTIDVQDKAAGITVTEGLNTAIGLVEGGEAIHDAITGKEGGTFDAEKIAALKTGWGVTKAGYECYQEYIKVSTGFDSAMKYPIPAKISITNADGYTTVRHHRLRIRLYEAGSGKGEWDWSNPGLRE